MSSNEQDNIIKAIGNFGDKSMSKAIVTDQEMNELINQIHYIIERRIEPQEAAKLEELINAYSARGTRIAYLTGFKDCMSFKQEVNSLI